MANDYVDRFIKQHKEYFQRNKKVIESNSWKDENKNSEARIENIFDQISKLKEKLDKKSQIEAKKLQKEVFEIKNSASRRKESLFDEETELTSSILGRLSAFIKETESSGDRKLPKVQSFIDDTVSIIDIHLNKCDEYLDYSMDELTEGPDNDDEVELRSDEIKFQDKVFNKKIKIQDTLNSLNITNSIENAKITFYKDQKASLPFMNVLPSYDDDIKQLTEQLDLPTEVDDITFHIHRDPKDIPKWNKDKHYWEQTDEVLKYWNNEWLKLTKGFTVDGYYFHPWLYFHLNFFKTPIPSEDGGDVIRVPDLRDNEWFIAEQLKAVFKEDGFYTKEALNIFGTRRFAKSVIMSSICEWRALIVPNVATAITSGSEGDLGELTHKIKTSMKVKEPAFIIPIQKQEWMGGTVEMGVKSDPSTLLEYSRHTIKNLAGGAKSSTQKTAGGAPSVFLIEEEGKFAWLKGYLAAKASFQAPFGLKTVIIVVGTSGETSLAGDALKAVSNPSKYKFREMDWDLLESKLPKGFKPTWKRRQFATFIPGQMGYKSGFKRIPRKFGEFLGIKSDYLDNITIYQTDWVNNTNIILEERKKAEGDTLLLQQETVQYPIDPEETFISAEKNPFNYEQARKHKEYLEETGLWDRRRELVITNGGKLAAELSNKELAPYPHPGGTVEAPILVFEDIPEERPVDNLYVCSFDDVKQDDSDTDSLISFQVWKMDTFGDEFGDSPVLTWACRPGNRREMYETWLLIQKTYNAKAFPENEDMGYKTFLENKHLDEIWLLQAVDFTASMNIANNGKRKYGWTPRQSKRILLGMFIEMCNEVIEVEQDDGTTVSMYGVQKINDIGLLDEIINYKEDGNFDRISAALGAVGWMHYLKKNWILPKMRKATNNDTAKKKIKKSYSPYTKSKGAYTKSRRK